MRDEVAIMAAHLLYEGDCREYYQAKVEAAARMEVDELPSNFEVRECLLELAEEREGEERIERLEAMRQTALEVMESLRDFSPRLVGSVATGYAHHRSDVDIHLYTDDAPGVFQELEKQKTAYRYRAVPNPDERADPPEFVHIRMDHRSPFKIEITIYPAHLLKRARKCGLTGGKGLRLDEEEVRELLA